VSPASLRSAALRANAAPASGTPASARGGAPPISAPPPAGNALEDDPILVVDPNDTSASPYPPPPDRPVAPPSLLEGTDFDSDDDSDEIDALYAMAQGDDRITDPPSEFDGRRSVLLHPAMLTVYAGALLFWLYAVLPDQDPQAEELPAPAAALPLPPFAPSTPPSAPPVPAAPTLVIPPASAPSPAAEAIEAHPRAEAAAVERAPRTRRAQSRRARAEEAGASEPRPLEPSERQVSAREERARPVVVEPSAAAVRDVRTAAELTREAEDAILRGDSNGAAGLYDRAIAADAGYAPAYRGKGLVLERLGRPDKAAEAFRTFLRLSPGSPSAAKVRERLDALDAQ
jgi:tetratricopeptide (TPR) repeat protein